ncbi:capsid protein [Mimosa mosaic virus]|uniref:Capsid protein n=1 Tax=Mimosa mosaic virus TaxID=3018030 RepID=A0AA95ECX7_9VIRU|nr:capsid protein [Mimosa mosaic virus]
MAARMTKAQLQAALAATRRKETPLPRVEVVPTMPRARRTRPRRRNQRKNPGSATVTRVAPSAVSAMSVQSIPRITGGRGSLTLTMSERVSTISVSDTGSTKLHNVIASYPPWLQGMAALFSKYKWLSLTARYVPTCPTTTEGAIHMCYKYDVSDTTPTTAAQMSVMQGYRSGAVWTSLSSPMEVGRLATTWYRYRVASSISSDSDVASTLVPAILVVMVGSGSSSSAVETGYIEWVYSISMCEPIPAALNA